MRREKQLPIGDRRSPSVAQRGAAYAHVIRELHAIREALAAVGWENTELSELVQFQQNLRLEQIRSGLSRIADRLVTRG